MENLSLNAQSQGFIPYCLLCQIVHHFERSANITFGLKNVVSWRSGITYLKKNITYFQNWGCSSDLLNH